MTNNTTTVKGPDNLIDLVGLKLLGYMAWSVFAPTLLTFIYGVTSWCLIKKFRHFRNYVMLSGTFANMMRSFVFAVSSTLITHNIWPQNVRVLLLPSFLLLYFALSLHGWLVVLCYVFFLDFVKVVRLDIRRRFLKSSLFAWGVPFLSMSLYYLSGSLMDLYYDREIITIPIAQALLFVPVTTNIIMYAAMLYSLFRASDTGATTATNKWQRTYISAMIFVLSNIIVLIYILELITIKSLIIDLLGIVLEYFHTLALSVYIVTLKTNRALWREYFDKRSNQNSMGMN